MIVNKIISTIIFISLCFFSSTSNLLQNLSTYSHQWSDCPPFITSTFLSRHSLALAMVLNSSLNAPSSRLHLLSCSHDELSLKCLCTSTNLISILPHFYRWCSCLTHSHLSFLGHHWTYFLKVREELNWELVVFLQSISWGLWRSVPFSGYSSPSPSYSFLLRSFAWAFDASVHYWLWIIKSWFKAPCFNPQVFKYSLTVNQDNYKEHNSVLLIWWKY